MAQLPLPSGRVRRRAGIEQGVLHASTAQLSTIDPSELVYKPGFVIAQGGFNIGTIDKRLGGGAMGTVYRFKLAKGGQCAAKAVSEAFTKKDKRLILEKQLVIECAIGFAMGRCVFTASIVRMVVPLPDVETTARGMLLVRSRGRRRS